MPRTSRMVAVGYPHHITQRGNSREPVFFDNHDRQTYLDLLKGYTETHQVDIWAYCLMPNHIHLLAVPQTPDSLALGIGRVNQAYTNYVNRKYSRSGRVWQNHFFSCVVHGDKHLWAVARYVDNNPVKSGLVPTAVEYRWSSARAHIDETPDALLSESCWLKREDRNDYCLFMLENDERMIDMINQATRSGRPFCGGGAVADLEGLLRSAQ